MWFNWNILSREMSWVGFWRKREQQSAWCLGGACSRCGGQSVRMCESLWFCDWSVGVEHACLTKSGESGKDCKGVVDQKDKRERNLWLRCITCKQFCILFVHKLGASRVAVGEVCSFDGVVLWEWGVQQYFGLSASVGSWECPWEENCNSLIWTIHKKLLVILLPLTDGAEAF